MRERQEFYDLFEPKLEALLIPLGFAGAEGKFSRRVGRYLHFVEAQERTDGSAISINLGVHVDFMPPAGGAEASGTAREQAECDIKLRLAHPGEADHWWRFGNPATETSDAIATLESEGLPFLARFCNFPEPLERLSADEVRGGEVSDLLPTMTKVRRLLLLARLHSFLGNRDRVREFAEAGIAEAGKLASGPKRLFRELLSQSATGQVSPS